MADDQPLQYIIDAPSHSETELIKDAIQSCHLISLFKSLRSMIINWVR